MEAFVLYILLLLLKLLGISYAFAVTVAALRNLGRRFATASGRRSRHRAHRQFKLRDIDRMPGLEFEQYVATLLERYGFTAEVTSGSNDFGVDVVAERDGERYAVQVKRHSRPINRTAVSDAVAGRDYYNCKRAMVITNASFTRAAQAFAASVGCELVDRKELRELIRG